MEYVTITHRETELTTIGAILGRRDHQLIVHWSAKELLDYIAPTEPITEVEVGPPEETSVQQSNKDRIFSKYHKYSNQTKLNQDRYDQGDYEGVEINIGSRYLVPHIYTDRETLFVADDNVTDTPSAKAFIGSALEELLRDPNYTQVNKLDTGGQVKTVNPDVTVFMWIRSLSATGKEVTGSWIDVSPYIISLETVVGKDGGSFNMSLAPVICVEDPKAGWIIDPASVKGIEKGRFSAESNVNTRRLKRSRFFFHTTVGENDLVYIRFEKLKRDRDAQGELVKNFSLNGLSIPGNTYDMIGLVDGNPQEVDSKGNDIEINVSGRDVMKLLIEDGSYFFPLQFSNGIFTRAGDTDQKRGKLLRRSQFDGSITALNAYTERSIEFSLKFIFNQLSFTGLIPTIVFTQAYAASKLSKKFSLTGLLVNGRPSTVSGNFEDGYQIDVHKLKEAAEKPDGIWSIIELVIDPSIQNRRIVDSSIALEQGSLINSINKLCQEPFVEFYGDTYGDKYHFIVRKQPFDKKGYRGMVFDDIESDSLSQTIANLIPKTEQISDLVMTIDETDVLQEELSYHQEAYSWYYLKPSGTLLGNEELAFAYTRAVAFEEYAEIWGSKPYQKIHNYAPVLAIDDSSDDARNNPYEEQLALDMQFLVQSHQYLPFTRKGSIEIHGSRLFKRGVFIYYKPTDEVFYVDQVINESSIGTDSGSNDRTTRLIVSRGMRRAYIKGVQRLISGKLKNVSYFDIIQTSIPGTFSSLNFAENWKVDKDIFNFFLRRKQWNEST